jgi:hypothetical protein
MVPVQMEFATKFGEIKTVPGATPRLAEDEAGRREGS